MIKLYGVFEDTKVRHLLDSTDEKELLITVEQLINNWQEEIDKNWYTFEKFVVVDEKGNEIHLKKSTFNKNLEPTIIKGIAFTDGKYWYLKDSNNELIKDECDDDFDAVDLLESIQTLSNSIINDGDEIEITIKRKPK